MKLAMLLRLSIFGVGLFGALGVMSGSSFLLVSGGLLISAMLFGAATYFSPRSASRVIVVHGLTLGGVLVALFTFPASRFDSVLLILMLGVFNRFLLRSGHRDDLLVIAASSVLLAAATTVTASVVFAALLLGFIPSLFWGLWAAMALGGTDKLVDRRPREMLMAWPASGVMVRIALGGLGLTVLGFVLVSILPRFSFAPVLAAGGVVQMPGASDSMTLDAGGVTPIRDTTVVIRVEPGEGQATESTSYEGLYARFYALDRFDGNTWSRSEAGHFRFAPPAFGGEPKGMRVVLLHADVRGNHQAIPAIGRDAPWFPNHTHIHEDLSGTWVVDRLASPRFAYVAVPDTEAPIAEVPPAFEHRRNMLYAEVPENLDPRIRDLAAQIFANKTTNRERISAVLSYFQRGGFEYSLEALEGSETTPLGRFLFESKKGHCELYAGATAILLRLGGMRARVATGYYNGVWNPMGGYLTFTRDNAHAWVEVHDGVSGWRWVDATPPDLRARATETSIIGSIRGAYEALDALWYDHVVDYDNQSIRRAFQSVANEVIGVAYESPSLTFLGRRIERNGGLGVLLLGAILIAVILLIRTLLTKTDDTGRLGVRLRHALGERSDENVTLGALVDRAPEEYRRQAARAVSLYEALRFGGDLAIRREVLNALTAFERVRTSKRRL